MCVSGRLSVGLIRCTGYVCQYIYYKVIKQLLPPKALESVEVEFYQELLKGKKVIPD